MTICDKNHRYAEILRDVEYSQSYEDGRHRCAGCAYEIGILDGLNNIKRNIEELALPYSQAGTGRHKSPVHAYELGWIEGQKAYKMK